MSETARRPTKELEKQIIERLRKVIDPETNIDVIRMRLVKDLYIDKGGAVNYTIEPSSPLCPVAAILALSIKLAVADVSGVKSQKTQIKNYVSAEELTKIINEQI